MPRSRLLMPRVKIINKYVYITPNSFISMSKTVGFNLNNDEILKACNNYNIREDDLGRMAKKIFLQEKSPERSEAKTNKPEDMIIEQSLQQIKKNIPDMTTEEIELALGINKEKKNQIDRKGLYTETNIDAYLRKFLREWDHNIQKIPECMAQLKIMCA